MATTTPTAAAPGGKLADWISIAALLLYVAVLVWFAIGRPPVKTTALHAVMTGSQTVARNVGRLGLHAEAAYRRNVGGGGCGCR